ncbi:putative cytochrome c oxidase subunit 2 [Frankia canadensis]|uniref:Cytochrome c oxidase subunit 2 n=1 Tax=Frankia canadensis TaxID=1836972 RepID=A0A2I2KZZ4_9ACTN|nr:cytochrome c oxidase subunit II [Frankia canadensis]SNQ51217.1 putative cytochrome c oxidase subunit 2 [Frankia canadensis]SOU58507.1 putative cytochrome c oxidase subunit 2 [Frankia canadensis]
MRRSFGRTRPSVADVSAGAGAGRAGSRGRRLRLVGPLALVGLAATACDRPNFGYPDGVTNHSPRLLNLWQGSAIAALVVGVIVWGMILYAVVAFRRRSDVLPRQVRYNLPVEILYTVVPVVVVASMFFYTARDESEVTKLSAHPDVTVDVIGFRWNWQFKYIDPGTGQTGPNQIEVTGRPGEPAVLVLPQGRSIRFVETSPDVIHSFWVPEFLFKRDVIPGRINQFELTVTKTGTFIGRCAELCGTDHDRMNFYVKVVPQDEYNKFIADRLNAPVASTSVAASASTAATGSGQ